MLFEMAVPERIQYVYGIIHQQCPELNTSIFPDMLTAWTDVMEEKNGCENKT